MYLTKDTFMKGTADTELELTYPGIQSDRVTNITERLGYWRKANAIHLWFVTNVQDGVDECQTSYVSRENLEALLDVAIKVNQNHALAAALLPAQAGFFFGSTDYDEWYFEDIKETIKILEAALNEETDVWSSIHYRSSW